MLTATAFLTLCTWAAGTSARSTPDPKHPTDPWIVHKVSQAGFDVPAQHGIGVGDINGDGRMDIVSPHGWWEQPGVAGRRMYRRSFIPLSWAGGRAQAAAWVARRWPSTT